MPWTHLSTFACGVLVGSFVAKIKREKQLKQQRNSSIHYNSTSSAAAQVWTAQFWIEKQNFTYNYLAISHFSVGWLLDWVGHLHLYRHFRSVLVQWLDQGRPSGSKLTRVVFNLQNTSFWASKLIFRLPNVAIDCRVRWSISTCQLVFGPVLHSLLFDLCARWTKPGCAHSFTQKPHLHRSSDAHGLCHSSCLATDLFGWAVLTEQHEKKQFQKKWD